MAILKRIGLPQPLAILATKTRAKRGDLLPEWGQFLREHSNFGTASTIKDTLRRRLVNLMERGMVSREGNVYVIEPEGWTTPPPSAARPNTAAAPRSCTS